MNSPQNPINGLANTTSTTQIIANLNLKETAMHSTAEELVSKISALRLPSNFSANAGGIKLPPKVIFGKFSKHRFARVHPGEEYKFPCLTVDDKDAGEIYIVAAEMQLYLGTNAIPKIIRLSVDSTGLPKLILQPISDPNSRQNIWHSSLNRGIEMAEKSWVRMEANMSHGQYDVIVSKDDLGDPQWPSQSMDELVQEVFGNKVIMAPDHPYVRQLEGRI
jgi:hypothetical protein